MLKFDKLPQLATGAHPAGSGYACIMNAISYLEGDTQVTDMPSCVFRPLARMAQLVNDTICTHGIKHANGLMAVLCGPCSHRMWLLGVDLIGTAEAAEKFAACPRPHSEGEMELNLFVAHTLIDQAVVRVEKLEPLSAMARLLKNRRSNPWLAMEMKTNARAVLDNDEYFSVKHCNVTWGLPWRASWLHALRMVANRDPASFVLESMVVDLMDAIPVELRFDFAKEVIEQFNEFTQHIPVRPTAGQVEQMRVKAGLVNV